MSVFINLPGGAIERVSAEDLLWFRLAFPSEWKGAVMVRMADERLYSSESVAALKAKFGSDGAKLAEFTPPDAKLVMVVNAAKVSQVDTADPEINPENAEAVLVFDRKTALAVKETPKQAQSLIDRQCEATCRRLPNLPTPWQRPLVCQSLLDLEIGLPDIPHGF